MLPGDSFQGILFSKADSSGQTSSLTLGFSGLCSLSFTLELWASEDLPQDGGTVKHKLLEIKGHLFSPHLSINPEVG